MQLRDAHWVAPKGPSTMPRASGGADALPLTPVKKPRTLPASLDKPQPAKQAVTKALTINGKAVALYRLDGQALCKQFQYGKCRNATCCQGLHQCGTMLLKGGVCNNGGHGAHACTVTKGAVTA